MLHSELSRSANRGIRFLKLTLGLTVLAFGAAAQAASAAPAAIYTYSDLQFPGAMGTTPTAINNVGTIAGYYWDTGYFAHGFVYSGGTFTQVDAPGAIASGTFVTGINDAGVLSGYYFPAKGGTECFTLKRGVFSFYSLPGVLDSYAQKINNQNVSVGWDITGFNTIESIRSRSGGRAQNFFDASTNATAAYGINNHNVVVGNGIPPGNFYQVGFIYANKAYSYYPYAGSYQSFFNGLNDSLQVVGDFNTVARGPVTAFIWEGGTFTNLIVPNAVSSIGEDINNSGVIVGTYTTGSQTFLQSTGFIAIPQP